MITSMKRTTILMVFTILSIASLTAQNNNNNSSRKGFYVGVAAGQAFKTGVARLTNNGQLRGSYGEGTQAQLRLGNYFTNDFALELGVTYLIGKPQQIVKDPLLDIKGSARVYSAAITAIYHVDRGFYVKAGLLTKVGGKSVVEGRINTTVPSILLNPTAPAELNSDIAIEFQRDNTGKLPFGFIGSFGYKHTFRKVSMLLELQYEGIYVSVDKSNLVNYNGTVTTAGRASELSPEQVMATLPALAASGSVSPERVAALGGLVSEEITYGENGVENFESPHSSIGILFGIAYSF